MGLLTCGFAISVSSASFFVLHAQSGPRLESSAFDRFTGCKFNDGLGVVETPPLAPGIHERTVDTLKGQRQVPMVEGRRVMFAYPGEDFYANVKVEILPEKDYGQTKEILIENFDYILASGGDTTRNYEMKPTLNGLDARGLDREKLEGGVLGIYLLLDDTSRIVTTIYFLNQEPKDRSFQTMEEYRAARDKFLVTYSACASGRRT
jgi:hypothetical protein